MVAARRGCQRGPAAALQHLEQDGDVGGAAAGAVVPPRGRAVEHLGAGDDVVEGAGRGAVEVLVREAEPAAVELLGTRPDPEPGGGARARPADDEVPAVDDDRVAAQGIGVEADVGDAPTQADVAAAGAGLVPGRRLEVGDPPAPGLPGDLAERPC